MELANICGSIWSLNNIQQYYLPKEDGISTHLLGTRWNNKCGLIPSSFGGQYCSILFRDQMEPQMWANSIFFKKMELAHICCSIWSLNNIEQYYSPKEDGMNPHLWFHLFPK
jgi:hypothetical protein